MKKFSKILIAVLILLVVGIGCFIFFLSSIPYSFYNSVINPSGIVSKNTLISYDGFTVKSTFVDSVKLSDFDIARDINKVKNSISNFDEFQAEIYKKPFLVKIGSVSVENNNSSSQYTYPDIRLCIEDKKGDLIYGLDSIAVDLKSLLNSSVNILPGKAQTLNMFALLDGMKYYKEGGYNDTDYADGNFSLDNLSSINIYPMTYYKTSKGNKPYTCSDFYKNESTPIKVIKID